VPGLASICVIFHGPVIKDTGDSPSTTSMNRTFGPFRPFSPLGPFRPFPQKTSAFSENPESCLIESSLRRIALADPGRLAVRVKYPTTNGVTDATPRETMIQPVTFLAVA
jgi:hypothetical protein